MIPSLRAGRLKYEPVSAIDAIHHEQPLAGAADGERLDGGDPRLLATLLEIGRRRSAPTLWPRYILLTPPSSRSIMNSTSEIFP